MRLLIPSILLLLATAAAGQVEQQTIPALASSVSDDEQYGWEDPELWGAHAVDAIPADARLIVDYETTAGDIRQRVRIYHEGFARTEWDQGQARIDRSLRLSEDSAEQWRKLVEDFAMAPTSYRPSRQLSNEINHASITLYRSGSSQRHEFSTAAALPAELGTLRALLDALGQAMVDDRQVANPLSVYTPEVGDVLIDPDGIEYEVMRVLETSRMVELRRSNPAMTTWAAQRDLYTMFTSIIPGGAPTK